MNFTLATLEDEFKKEDLNKEILILGKNKTQDVIDDINTKKEVYV